MSNLLRLIKHFFKFQRHHWIQTAQMHRNHFKVVKSLAIVFWWFRNWWHSLEINQTSTHRWFTTSTAACLFYIIMPQNYSELLFQYSLSRACSHVDFCPRWSVVISKFSSLPRCKLKALTPSRLTLTKANDHPGHHLHTVEISLCNICKQANPCCFELRALNVPLNLF